MDEKPTSSAHLSEPQITLTVDPPDLQTLWASTGEPSNEPEVEADRAELVGQITEGASNLRPVELDEASMQSAARVFLNVDQPPLDGQLPASVELPSQCQEAQNALSSAITSAENALHTGAVINRLTKVSNGRRVLGVWPVRAQDNLRAALLFAGAGLDKALKSLVEDALPRIIDVDDEARGKFESWAQDAISNDAGVDPEQLVRILLSRGETPRDILTLRYVTELCRGSAQSSSRVDELASALGVTAADIRTRVAPTKKGKPKKAIEKAFDARNEIAHELDVKAPKASAREPMERIRQPRRAEEVKSHVVELLEVGQLIINDVATRAWGAKASG